MCVYILSQDKSYNFTRKQTTIISQQKLKSFEKLQKGRNEINKASEIKGIKGRHGGWGKDMGSDETEKKWYAA